MPLHARSEALRIEKFDQQSDNSYPSNRVSLPPSSSLSPTRTKSKQSDSFPSNLDEIRVSTDGKTFLPMAFSDGGGTVASRNAASVINKSGILLLLVLYCTVVGTVLYCCLILNKIFRKFIILTPTYC